MAPHGGPSRPPAVWRALLKRLVPDDPGGELLAELAERHARLAAEHGRALADRWYRGQALRTLLPALTARTRSLRRGPWRRLAAEAGDDLRAALRQASRSPAVPTAIALVLALGVGATATMASVVQRTLWSPVPYADSEELVLIWGRSSAREGRFPLAAPDAAAIREQASALESLAFALRTTDTALEWGGEPHHARVAMVTTNLFDVLRVAPTIGRTLSAEDAVGPGQGTVQGEQEIRPTALLLAGRAWRRQEPELNASITEARVSIDGEPARIVGVLRNDFALVLPADAGLSPRVDAWAPIRVDLADFRRDEGRLIDQDSQNSGATIGRLAPGATLPALRAELDVIAARLREQIPRYAEVDFRLQANRLPEEVAQDSADMVRLLSLGTVLLLLVCSVNASTLWLAALSRRRGELAVRGAIGASGGRLRRELAAEWSVLTCTALLLGCPAALFTASHLNTGADDRLSLLLAHPTDVVVIPATALVSATLSGLLALWPALSAAKPSPALILRSRGRERESLGLRRAFTIVQIALSVVLLAGAALLYRSTSELLRVDPGFEVDDTITFSLSLRAPGRYRGPADRARFAHELRSEVADLPGVEAIGLVGSLPLAGERWSQPYGTPEQSPSEWARNRADFRVVTSGYFQAMGVRVHSGRGFTPEEDLVESERVAVVDTTLARRIAPDGRVVGRRIGVPIDGRAHAAEIVGVVEPVKHHSLRTLGPGTIYIPYRQEASRDVAFVVRRTAAVEPGRLVSSIRAVVTRLDPGLPVYDVGSMRGHLDAAVRPVRSAGRLLGLFGLVAAISSTLSLYGVMALAVGSRKREIGIRMALGSTRSLVLREVMVEALAMISVGAGTGFLVAALGSGWLEGILFGVTPFDLVTWVGLLGLVIGISLLAAVVPARRAAWIEPRSALDSS